jgi:Ring finger domain
MYHRRNLRRRRGVRMFDCESVFGSCHDNSVKMKRAPTGFGGRPALRWFQQIPNLNIVHSSSFSSRSLQNENDNNSDVVDSPHVRLFAMLVMACIIVCLAFTPMCVYRRCKRRREMERQERLRRLYQRALEEGDSGNGISTDGPGLMFSYDDDSAAADFIRTSLQNFNLHETSAATTTTTPTVDAGFSYNFSIRSMSLEDRKEYLENLLICKRIIKIRDDGVETKKMYGDDDREKESHSPEDQDDAVDDEKNGADGSKTIEVLFGDEVDVEKTTTSTIAETCPICLVEYQECDILVWSQSEKCNHMFHKHCMVEWLLQNEECPLCRHNYLSLSDDGDDDDDFHGHDENQNYEQLRNVLPIYQSESNRTDYNSSYQTASAYRNNMYLQHRNHSLTVPPSLMLPTSSSSHLRQRGELYADRDQAPYMSGVELVQLLQSLQMLSDTQQNASVRLDGIELAYPNRRSRQTLHETRSSYSIPQRRDHSVIFNIVEGENHIEDDESNDSNSNSTEVTASPSAVNDVVESGHVSESVNVNDSIHVPSQHDPQQTSAEQNLETNSGDDR